MFPPSLEAPKRGVLIPLGERSPEPLHEVCIVSLGVSEPLTVIYNLVGDHLLQAQILQGCPKSRIRIAYENLGENPRPFASPLDDRFRLILRLPPSKEAALTLSVTRSPGLRAGRSVSLPVLGSIRLPATLGLIPA